MLNNITIELAKEIKKEALPFLGKASSSEITGKGAVVGLEDTFMTSSDEWNIQSLVAANSKELHTQIIKFIDNKFEKMKRDSRGNLGKENGS